MKCTQCMYYCVHFAKWGKVEVTWRRIHAYYRLSKFVEI